MQKHAKGMDEWAQVLKRTKLLDAGVSIAIPMLSLEVDENDLSDPFTSTSVILVFVFKGQHFQNP